MRTIVSILVPAYQEQDNIERLVEELKDVFANENLQRWEIIFVDDGSRDHTWERILSMHYRDSRVKGLRLTRNFGHQYAIFAGLFFSNGSAVITMDADLQHPPSVIPKLLEAWREGNMVVNTIRLDNPKETWLKRITSRAFYLIFSFLSGVKINAGMADFRLLDRQVAEKLLYLKDYHLFLRGIVQWMGYPYKTVSYRCAERFTGRSHYSLFRMARFAWTGITSYSIIPLRLATFIGIATSCFAFSGFIYAIYAKYVLSDVVAGWTSLLSYMSLLFGILFILIGIVGEYLAQVLEQVRGRPRFLLSEQIGLSASLERQESKAEANFFQKSVINGEEPIEAKIASPLHREARRI